MDRIVMGRADLLGVPRLTDGSVYVASVPQLGLEDALYRHIGLKIILIVLLPDKNPLVLYHLDK